MRALAVAGLALSLTGCAWLRHHPAGPSCESLDAAYAATIDGTRAGVLPADFLRVPVVIHLMSDPEEVADDKWPEKHWTPAVVDRYFGTGNVSVNAAWAAARIHFDLTRVERCLYTPPAGAYERTSAGNKGILPPDAVTLRSRLPAAQAVIIDHYLQLNLDVGAPRALNVYLWRTIFGGVNGYGESPHRNRIEVSERGLQALATVWFESFFSCDAVPGGDDCQLALAHETGHALGLLHSCRFCDCCSNLCWQPRDYYFTCQAAVEAAQSWNNWCPCEGNPVDATFQGLNVCGEQFECCGARHRPLKRLMFPAAGDVSAGSGFTLCDAEIESARSAVIEFF